MQGVNVTFFAGIVQVSEITKKKEQLKIQPADHLWVSREQDRIKETEGLNLSQASLFARMRAAYEGRAAAAAPPSQRTDHKNSGAHEELDRILSTPAGQELWKFFLKATGSSGRRKASTKQEAR